MNCAIANEGIIATTGTLKTIDWELPFFHHAEQVIVGWRKKVEIDSGLNIVIAQVLATALCEVGVVAFLSLTPQPFGAERWQATCAAPNIFQQFATLIGWTKSGGLPYLWVTRDPAVAALAFDQACFNWSLRAQFLLVADTAADFEVLANDDMLDILQLDEKALGSIFARTPLKLIVSSGVDGDVAGISLRRDGNLVNDIMKELETAARQYDVGFENVSAAAFPERMAA
jgi:hypothetical protein